MTVTPATQTAAPASPALPGDGPGQRVDAPAGRVTITLSARAYEEGQVISALIANGLERTVHAQDSKTDCTIAFLQRGHGTEWVDLLACAVMRPPITLAIGPQHGRTVTFDPSSRNFAALPERQPALGPGTYRVKFTFRLSPGPEGEERLAAFSPVFAIH